MLDGGKSTYNPLTKTGKNDEVGSLRYEMALHVRTTRESFGQVCYRFFVNSSSVASVYKQNPSIGGAGDTVCCNSWTYTIIFNVPISTMLTISSITSIVDSVVEVRLS